MTRRRRALVRRGLTLVELAIVMIGVTACASLAVVVLLGMMRHQAATSNQIRLVTTLSRLESLFREDVHGATGAKIAHDRIVLATKRGEIEYALEADDLLQRRLRFAEGDVRVDRIDLVAPCTLTVEESILDDVTLLSLLISTKRIDRTNDSREALSTPQRNARFTAELGRDYRWNTVNES